MAFFSCYTILLLWCGVCVTPRNKGYDSNFTQKQTTASNWYDEGKNIFTLRKLSSQIRYSNKVFVVLIFSNWFQILYWRHAWVTTWLCLYKYIIICTYHNHWLFLKTTCSILTSLLFYYQLQKNKKIFNKIFHFIYVTNFSVLQIFCMRTKIL